MADIELLDALVLQSVKLETEGPEGTATSSLGSPAATPPAKRRRRGGSQQSPAGSAEQPLVAAKVEAVKVEAEGCCDQCSCSGCGRRKGIDKCFLQPENVVVWAYPDGRGNWCGDCQQTWRCVFQGVHTLRLFEKWLRCPLNLQTFLVHLLAYVTLVREGSGAITAAKVIERVTFLRFLADLLGFPLGPFEIVANTGGQNDASVDTRLCVPMTVDGKVLLGVFRPVEPQVAAMGQQPFPRSFFNYWAALPAGLGAGAGSAAAGAEAKGPETTLAVSAAATVPKNRLESMLEIVFASSQKLLGAFAGDQWAAVKETPLKKLVAEAAALSTEAGADGQEKVFLQADALAQGLAMVKKLLGVHRYHKMTKTLFGKFPEMAEPAAASWKFLDAVLKTRPSLTFTLLVLRSSFAGSCSGSASLEKATSDMMADLAEAWQDVRAHIAKATGPQGSTGSSNAAAWNPSLWLRTLFFEGVQAALLGQDGKDKLREKAHAVMKDVQAAAELFKNTLQSGCDEFLQDLAALSLILSGPVMGEKGVSPKLVKDAVGRLQAKELAPFTRAVEKVPCWAWALATCGCVLQVSSQDELADEKLSRAAAILQDESLLHMVAPVDGEADGNSFAADPASRRIENLENLTDGTVLDALGESLASAVEAVQLWSATRGEMNSKKLAQWFADAARAVAAVSDISWLCLHACVIRAGLPQLAGEAVTSTTLKSLSDALTSYCPDGALLDDFLDRLLVTVSEWPDHLKTDSGFSETFEFLDKQVAPQMQTRTVATEVLDLFIALPLDVLGETSSEIFVADWTSKLSQGAAKDSSFSHVLNFAKALQRLTARVSARDLEPVQDFTVELVYPETVLTASFKAAVSLGTSLPGFPCFSLLEGLAGDSLVRVGAAFEASLHLDWLNIQGASSASKTSLGLAFKGLVREAKVLEMAKVAQKALTVQPAAWPCEDFPFRVALCTQGAPKATRPRISAWLERPRLVAKPSRCFGL